VVINSSVINFRVKLTWFLILRFQGISRGAYKPVWTPIIKKKGIVIDNKKKEKEKEENCVEVFFLPQ